MPQSFIELAQFPVALSSHVEVARLVAKVRAVVVFFYFERQSKVVQGSLEVSLLHVAQPSVVEILGLLCVFIASLWKPFKRLLDIYLHSSATPKKVKSFLECLLGWLGIRAQVLGVGCFAFSFGPCSYLISTFEVHYLYRLFRRWLCKIKINK